VLGISIGSSDDTATQEHKMGNKVKKFDKKQKKNNARKVTVKKAITKSKGGAGAARRRTKRLAKEGNLAPSKKKSELDSEVAEGTGSNDIDFDAMMEDVAVMTKINSAKRRGVSTAGVSTRKKIKIAGKKKVVKGGMRGRT